ITSLPDRINIGLFIPMQGDAGIWGPSCRACAELACHEINHRGGINGTPIKLKIFEAGASPEAVGDLAYHLTQTKQIDAIVGMHTSDVRQQIILSIPKSTPYIYTPLWEGGVVPSNVLCLGETPKQQLSQAIPWLIKRYHLKKWYLLGHQYVWPRFTNSWVKKFLYHSEQQIVAEKYLPLGVHNFSEIIDDIQKQNPCAILLTLVGQGCVAFNRQFGAHALSDRILRLSTAVEENMMLSIGETNTEGLFSTSGYFSCINDLHNDSFRERYFQQFGEYAPPLSTMGQSVYDGVRLLSKISFSKDQYQLKGPRKGVVKFGVASKIAQIYLAQSQGINFRIIQRFHS
ncbi:MAG: substrate-binding domain-containing protein, partial [Pseudomonadota bacterium]